MANFCMLCGKKLGFFSSYGEDFLTGRTDNKICDECIDKTDVIFKKIEMKIPLEEDDFERFTETGRTYVNEYLELGGDEPIIAEEPEESEEQQKLNVMEHEIGDAVIDRTFEVDDEEAENVLSQLKEMDDEKIEQFLEGLVSENDTAEGFMNEVKALNDAELQAVIDEQREFYNNAEWAYVLYVKYFREALKKALKEKEEEAKELTLPEDRDIDIAEIDRMTEKYRDFSKEELEAILGDSDYTYEARLAAKNLLATKQ